LTQPAGPARRAGGSNHRGPPGSACPRRTSCIGRRTADTSAINGRSCACGFFFSSTDIHVPTSGARASCHQGRAEQCASVCGHCLSPALPTGRWCRTCAAVARPQLWCTEKRGLTATQHLHELPGNTVLELVVSLERSFHKYPGTYWANMHLWHIDHKVATAKFQKLAKLKEQLKCVPASHAGARQPGPGRLVCEAPLLRLLQVSAACIFSCSARLANFLNSATASLCSMCHGCMPARHMPRRLERQRSRRTITARAMLTSTTWRCLISFTPHYFSAPCVQLERRLRACDDASTSSAPHGWRCW